MNMQEILKSFSQLLENRAMGDAVINDSDVVVAGTSILHGIMYITVQANDGTVKHFRLTEV